jgi:hypothetical protein
MDKNKKPLLELCQPRIPLKKEKKGHNEMSEVVENKLIDFHVIQNTFTFLEHPLNSSDT